MPKPNQKGGKNFKKGKKNSNTVTIEEPKATESFHRYAQVLKKVGGNTLELNCSDGINRHGIIPGKMHKRIWMNVGDILLVELNNEINKNAKKEQCFITHKYSTHCANNLKNMNLISFNVNSDEDDESDIKFGEDTSKMSSNDDIYDEIDKLENEEKNNKDSSTDSKKDKLENKTAQKKIYRENAKVKDQAVQSARSQKDNFDGFDFDSL